MIKINFSSNKQKTKITFLRDRLFSRCPAYESNKSQCEGTNGYYSVKPYADRTYRTKRTFVEQVSCEANINNIFFTKQRKGRERQTAVLVCVGQPSSLVRLFQMLIALPCQKPEGCLVCVVNLSCIFFVSLLLRLVDPSNPAAQRG
jgi:hypothetical protein